MEAPSGRYPALSLARGSSSTPVGLTCTDASLTGKPWKTGHSTGRIAGSGISLVAERRVPVRCLDFTHSANCGRSIRADTIRAGDQKIRRPLRWLTVLGLLPVLEPRERRSCSSWLRSHSRSTPTGCAKRGELRPLSRISPTPPSRARVQALHFVQKWTKCARC